MRAVSVALLLLAGTPGGVTALSAQRQPQSFVVTALTATAGAAAGFTLGLLVAQQLSGPDDLSVGSTSAVSRDYSNLTDGGYAIVWGTTALGAASGAMLGRHLTDGRGYLPGALLGAVGGVLLGGLILWGDDSYEENALAAITLTVPTALFSTLTSRGSAKNRN